MKNAVQIEWNNMENYYIMIVPMGSSITVLEGTAGQQRGALYGGGNQIYLDYESVPKDWITTIKLR